MQKRFIYLFGSILLAVLVVIAVRSFTEALTAPDQDLPSGPLMELATDTDDGSHYCVQFTGEGQRVFVENCGDTTFKLSYDDDSQTFKPGHYRWIELDYEASKFDGTVYTPDGEFIGGFRP